MQAWSVAATANPNADVEAGKLAIQQFTGFTPNTLVLGPQVLSALRLCQAIKDQFKYTSAESINLAMLARYFDIDRVLVLGGVYETAVEGAASSMSFIGGKHALLCYTTDAPSLMTPTAGYTFSWSGFTGSQDGFRTKRMRAELLSSDRNEGEMALDMKIVAPSMGYFFNNVVA